MYEHNRSKVYSQLRNLISEEDLIKCIHLVNNIKEYRHNKPRKDKLND